MIRQWLSEQAHLIRKSPEVITLLRAFVEKILKRNKMMNAAEMIDALLEEKVRAHDVVFSSPESWRRSSQDEVLVR